MEKVAVMIGRMNSWMLLLARVFVVGIMVTILFDVAIRIFFSFGIGALYSLAELLIACLVFSGLPYCQMSREHINVNLIVQRLSPSWQHIMEIIVLFLSLIMVSTLTYSSWAGAVGAYRIGDVTSGEPGILTWPAKTIMAVSFTLWCFELIIQIIMSPKRVNLPHLKKENH
jgi:TRAP-type C4-dicarboxylate transport system permease small subunit